MPLVLIALGGAAGATTRYLLGTWIAQRAGGAFPWGRTGDAAKVNGEVELGLATDVGAEFILIDVPLDFEPVGIWAGDW